MRLVVEEKCQCCQLSLPADKVKTLCATCENKSYNDGYLRGLEDSKFMILVVRKHLTETQQIPGYMDNTEKSWFERGGNATLTGMDKLLKEAIEKKVGQK